MRTKVRADALRNEADYLPASVDDLAELRRRIIAAGYAANVANGLVGWLVSKMAGERDITSSTTRSGYRKILAELAGNIGPGPGGQDDDVIVLPRPAEQRRWGGTERPPIILAPVVTSSRRPQHVDKLAELAA